MIHISKQKLVIIKTVLKIAIPVAAIITLLLLGCKKNNGIPAGKQKVSIYLTNNPVNFQAVNIDIQKVEVKVETDSAGVEREFWETLNTRPGIYNILNFRNGIDALLASGFVTNGEQKNFALHWVQATRW